MHLLFFTRSTALFSQADADCISPLLSTPAVLELMLLAFALFSKFWGLFLKFTSFFAGVYMDVGYADAAQDSEGDKNLFIS